MSAGGRSVIRRFDKTSDVFFGLCVETDDMNIDDLPNFPGILRAWPVGRATLHAARAASPVGNIVSDGNYSVHSLTGVDKLHAKGIYGKGAKVAVVDTGIDYKHHAVRSFLSLSAFPEINNGSSVEDSGMDSKSPVAPILLEITVSTKMAMLRKRGYNTTNRGLAWPFPDDDPFDYQGHGTQVAGVIAGKTDWFNGVAPEATLYSYKVFSNDVSLPPQIGLHSVLITLPRVQSQVTDEDIIIDAFLQAYKDGVSLLSSLSSIVPDLHHIRRISLPPVLVVKAVGQAVPGQRLLHVWSTEASLSLSPLETRATRAHSLPARDHRARTSSQ